MNKWKMAFFGCLAVLVVLTGFYAMTLLYAGLGNSYCEVTNEDLEDEFEQLIQLVNETDLSKSQICKKLSSSEDEYIKLYHYTDTIQLNRMILIFENNDKLQEIKKQW